MLNNKSPKLPPRGAASNPPERPSQPNPGNIINRVVPAPSQKVPDASSQGAALLRDYSKPKDSNNNDQSPPYTYTEPYKSQQGSSGNKRHGICFDNDFSAITDAQVSPFSNRGNSHGSDDNANSRSNWHLGAPRGGRY